jgi:pantoate--beta-alanine ligase
MIICKTIEEMRAACPLRLSPNSRAFSLGLVPTMGSLHAGHLSLIRKSKRLAEKTAVSIFVNPAQFDDADDLERYPRDDEADIAALENEGVDFLFMPSANEIYPQGFSTYVNEEVFSQGLCGKNREGHFKGVLTVVLKLFNIIRPDIAVFGEKDLQQLLLVEKMARELNLGIKIVAGETVREEDGLAMSSRNKQLGAEGRKLALKIYSSLANSKTAEEARTKLMASGIDKIEYVETVETPRGVYLATAVTIDGTRLIDNVKIKAL